MTETDKLDWKPWTTIEDVPQKTLLLVEIFPDEYRCALIRRESTGRAFGCIGDHFYFDRDPIRWAVIEHLKPEQESTGG